MPDHIASKALTSVELLRAGAIDIVLVGVSTQASQDVVGRHGCAASRYLRKIAKRAPGGVARVVSVLVNVFEGLFTLEDLYGNRINNTRVDTQGIPVRYYHKTFGVECRLGLHLLEDDHVGTELLDSCGKNY